MPEIIPNHVPSPRTLLAWDGAAYRPVAIDALGRLNVNVLTNLGLDDALQSVATDRLIVRGGDQLFSFRGTLHSLEHTTLVGDDGYSDSIAVPAGQFWVVTTTAMRNMSRATTAYIFRPFHTAVLAAILDDRRDFAVGQWGYWAGHTFLAEDDVIRCYNLGGLDADDTYVSLTGYRMTRET